MVSIFVNSLYFYHVQHFELPSRIMCYTNKLDFNNLKDREEAKSIDQRSQLANFLVDRLVR